MNTKLRLKKFQNFIEIETFLSNPDLAGLNGREIIMQVTDNNINSKTTFYTDSNGLFIEKRIRNYRENFQLSYDDAPYKFLHSFFFLLFILELAGITTL